MLFFSYLMLCSVYMRRGRGNLRYVLNSTKAEEDGEFFFFG